ncbi:hypothetical protein SpCBS45565_g08249 [Spizellomyces sp. 'palustris']|nr:hypothetical protein SpCBS45565_g08249 [Spizellomyces sp. 'palustris']
MPACCGITKIGFPCPFKDTTGYGYCKKHLGGALGVEGMPPVHAHKPSKKAHSKAKAMVLNSSSSTYDGVKDPCFPNPCTYVQSAVTDWYGAKLERERVARTLDSWEAVENTKPSTEWVKRQHEYLKVKPSLRQLLHSVAMGTFEFRPKERHMPSKLRRLVKGIWEAPRTDRDIIIFHGRNLMWTTVKLDSLRTLCTSYDFDCAAVFGAHVLRLTIPHGTPAIFIGGREEEILLPPGFLTGIKHCSPVNHVDMISATFKWRQDLNLDVHEQIG